MKKGFTLIELLVVIAIIGILSSVVLASLNSARGKGSNAAVKSAMANMRAQAELYYDGSGQQYTGVCQSATSGIASMLASAKTNGLDGTATCVDNATAWSASIPLKVAEGTNGVNTNYCVGSSGASKAIASTSAWTATDCQ